MSHRNQKQEAGCSAECAFYFRFLTGVIIIVLETINSQIYHINIDVKDC